MSDTQPVVRWHELVESRDPSGMRELFHPDAVFVSPILHTPQRGRELTIAYLTAAFEVFMPGGFRYVRQVVDSANAVLEFETEIDGIIVNGVDMLRWAEDGSIIEFKVMVRPLKAIEVVHRRMAAMLQRAPGTP